MLTVSERTDVWKEGNGSLNNPWSGNGAVK